MNFKEKGMGGSHGGKVSFNPLAGNIVSTEWGKPKGDLGKMSPPVGKESGKPRKMFRNKTKAQEVLRLIGDKIDFFGSRF